MTRIHVQNAPGDPDFAITPDMWAAADTTVKLSFGDTAEAFIAGVAEADALVTTTGQLRTNFPCPAPRLKLIFCTSAGLDRLAPYEWLPPGVALLNNGGAHSRRAGEYAAMAVLMLAGHMPAMIASQAGQRWEKRYAASVSGKTLGVIGTGNLGAAGARAMRMFGMTTIGVRTQAEPHPDFDEIIAVSDLDTVLPRLDILLIAAPLTPQTRNLLDRRRLALLPKGAGLINIGRGALVEQDALCDLLDAGHLGGAVLDVFTPEPVPPGHRLWTTRNLVMTPHCSADDPKTYAPDSVAIFLRNLAAFHAGQPMPTRFDTTRGY